MQCKNLLARLTKQIMQWGDTLSQVGKEVMIKAVGQAIPNYILGVFKLPRYVCYDLNRMIHKFWWGPPKSGARRTGNLGQVY